MEKPNYVWIDGKIIDWDDANIHLMNHTLHYGGGVFEGIRFYETENGSAVFRLKEHIDRLFYSMGVFDMEIEFNKEDIKKAIIELIRKNEIKSGYIRPIVYFGYGKMGLEPKDVPINTAIMVWEWGKYLGENPVKVKTSSIVRHHPGSTDQKAKITGSYFNSILASQEVHKLGYDEALLLDYKGNIAEGPGENFFVVRDGKLITPKLGNILPGITRDCLIKIANDEGISVEEKELTLDEVYGADEAFFCGTAAEVTSIESLDNKKFKESSGPVTEKLREIFIDIVNGKNDKYSGWLSYIK